MAGGGRTGGVQVQESRKRFYALSNRTQDGIYSFNLSIRKYVYTNPAFIRMFGHPCKDIATTDSVMGRIVPGDRRKLRQKIDASVANGQDGDEMEYRCVDNDGNLRWMHDRWVVLRGDNGEPLALEGIVRDITEMKDTLVFKDYLVSVLESCMDAIVVTDPRGVVTLANKGAETLFRVPRQELIGSQIGNFVSNAGSDPRTMYQILLDHAPSSNYECEVRLRDGATVPLLISSALLTDAKSCITGVISYMRDISVRKQAERRIRTLSQQLMRTKEVEMSRIARDLHDHLAQNLYALNIQLAAFLDRLPIAGHPLADRAEGVLQSLRKIMGDTRQMVFNIHPTGLHTLGVVYTLRNLCESISKIHGISVNFKAAGVDSLRMGFDVSIAIYRIVQEAINNIVKHANATQAEVRLVYSYPKIIIRIEDDGRGFDVQQTTEAGNCEGCMGIWSMRERVALLGGELSMTSRPGEGTRIVAEIVYEGD